MTVWLWSTPSTMKHAAQLAAAGDPHGTVVVAEEQTEGIGRHGHSWESQLGGLYLSIILRLELDPALLPILTMALGLAVHRAINDMTDFACDLRWPNDVLLNEKKVAGTIVHAIDGGTLIAGIGVNVNQTAFPPELEAIATSLRVESGEVHSKHRLFERIVGESLRYANLVAARGKGPILRQFEAQSSYVRGKAVQVDAGDRMITGVTAGLDENGFLRVRTLEGSIETIMSGGVRPA